MVAARHGETVHCHYLTFKSLYQFATSQDLAYIASHFHITTSVRKAQQVRRRTHVGSNKTMPRQKRADNRPPTSNINLMDTREAVKK